MVKPRQYIDSKGRLDVGAIRRDNQGDDEYPTVSVSNARVNATDKFSSMYNFEVGNVREAFANQTVPIKLRIIFNSSLGNPELSIGWYVSNSLAIELVYSVFKGSSYNRLGDTVELQTSGSVELGISGTLDRPTLPYKPKHPYFLSDPIPGDKHDPKKKMNILSNDQHVVNAMKMLYIVYTNLDKPGFNDVRDFLKKFKKQTSGGSGIPYKISIR
jgi:hypothetical protein